jgi:hypothetical protein
VLVAFGGLSGPLNVAAAGNDTFRPAGLLRLGTVVVRDLPSTPAPGHPAGRKPFLSPWLQTPASAAPAHGLLAVDTATSTASATPAATTPTVTSAFPVWSAYQSQTTFNQWWTPPDTQLAAGPAVSGSQYCAAGCLMEMVNNVGSVWSKSGSLTSSFDLAAFFKVPSGQTFSDPRVLYDAPSGRWFATGLSYNSTYGSQIYVAVSSTADPTGAWTPYSGNYSSTVFHDNPKVGVSADKVVMTWNDSSSGTFQGSVIWVIQKSDLLAAASPAIAGTGPNPSRPSIAPAQNLSYDATAADTAFAVYNNSPYVGLLTITGTPRAGNLALGESDPYMGATAPPPKADQPGFPGTIETDDSRFLGAVWQSGTLWTSANDGCGTVACGRLVAVSTGATPSVTYSQDLGVTGGDVYYPAVTMDQAGDMVAVYTVSSTSTYPSVGVIGATLSGSTYTLLSGRTVNSGQNIYSYGTCLTSPACRWGDNSGAAVDPTDPTEVWVTGEYSASNAGASNNWGTYTSRVTLSAPTVTGIAPSSGSAGTSVTISGTGFSTAAGATTVGFGTVAATQVNCGTTTTCTATAPAGSGIVDVTVTVNGLTSATSSSDLFNYGTSATPDFGISVSPSTQAVATGQSTSYTTTLIFSGGFANTVTLSAGPAITGIGYSFNPTSLTPPASGATLTVSAGSAAVAGAYTLTITGTSGSTTHSATVQLIVQDFAVTASRSSISIVRGQSGSCVVTATSTDGYAGTVTWSVTGLPAGVKFTFSPSSVAVPANGSAFSTLTLSTAPWAAKGTYTLAVTGTSGPISHSTTVSLTITGKQG